MKKLLILMTVMVLVFGMTGIVGAEEYFVEGQWEIEVKDDPLTDEFTMFMFNQEDYSNALMVRYNNNNLDIFIATDYLGTGSDQYFADIMYRFDKGKLIEDLWETATNDEGLFFSANDNHNKKDFLKLMMEKEELSIGYWPYQENRKSITYDLTGFTAAITPYLDEIGMSDLK